ncbi:Myosin-IIIb [Hypsibius exemplaris]|uniref:Myosin-IIIb n=1 Tax=Hypsibius exemplaris TaxID=2072580 RepID=A0A9X6NI60_HYPEX|nr:Myosin-IIIb [Hypsibius exemplaris]
MAASGSTQPPLGGQLLLSLDADDLAAVSFLDEAMIVAILKCRYRKKVIFTFIGEILLSVNPFERISHRRKSLREAPSRVPGYTKPDISVTANRVYTGLMESKRSQCCIFSGESGSGKTEMSKMFLSHLMRRCAGEPELESKIILFNPLLEAFGNAKTSLNDNSSRFGKFIELQFNGTGKVIGAKICEYLLEKSRVTHRSAGETNFHIFHHMLSTFSAEQLKKFKLNGVTNSGYLADSLADPSSERTARKLDGLTEGLTTIGFSLAEQDAIFSILAAIIHLGCVKFDDHPETGQPFERSSQKSIRNSASLLKIDRVRLHNQLQNLEIYSRGEVISRPYTRTEAEDCRDSISKALYNRLFGWLIYRINQVLAAPKSTQATLTVGILDIFGFENLKTNSFEQLCINLANEQLHNFFNTKIFKQEQQEYAEEGLDMESIAYRDNSDLLIKPYHKTCFLDRPIGILSLIDEECHFPQGSDSSLVTKFTRNFGNCRSRFRSSFYPVPERELPEPSFTISHYAGEITYSVRGFLEKNRDSLPDRVVVVLQSSTHSVVSSLFNASLARERARSFSTGPRQRRSRTPRLLPPGLGARECAPGCSIRSAPGKDSPWAFNSGYDERAIIPSPNSE